MKKRLKILSIIVIILLGITIHNYVKASEITTDTTKMYKNWQNLSEEEKQNYIQPLPFSITYDKSSNTYKRSRFNILNSLKASYEPEYIINGMTVKNQENTGSCWAFSTTALLESNILKSGKTTPFFSTRHMEYATSYTFLDGINEKGYKREVGSGGNVYLGLSYMTAGNGPVLEEDMPFENNEDKIYLSDIEKDLANEMITEYTSIPAIYKEYQDDQITYTNGYDASSPYRVEYTEQEVEEIRNMVKEQIVQYGGVSAVTYSLGEDYYNIDKVQNSEVDSYAYYCDDENTVLDHAVTIVGWDDNYSKENFNEAHKPLHDGAYIILNSWGEDMLNDGYIYISYDDALVETMLYGIVESQEKDYDTIYQYDTLGANDEIYLQTTDGQYLDSAYAANVFTRNETSEEVETIDKISFSIVKGTKDIELYINPESGDLTKCEFVADLGTYTPGYYTYELETPIEVTGDKFVVALKYDEENVTIPVEYNAKENNSLQVGDNFWDTAKGNAGESFVSADGKNWADLITDINIKQANVSIKAFTTYSERPTINVTGITLNMETNIVNIGEEFTLEATVTPENATNKNVIWTTDDETIATVDSQGKVRGIREGTTVITATTEDGNKTATCTVEVTENAVIPVTAIQLTVSKDTIGVGETCTIGAEIVPDNATNQEITWSSADENIATVNESGEVTGIGEGKVTITATNEANAIRESVMITVLNESENPTEDEENNNNSDNNDEPIQISPVEPENNNSANNNDDDTVSNIKLPYAGIQYGIIVLLTIVVIAGIYFFIRLYHNRDVK